MAQVITTVINGQPAMVAADLVATRRACGLWHVQLADCGATLTGDATEDQARQILSEA